jgi:hypothetical protein
MPLFNDNDDDDDVNVTIINNIFNGPTGLSDPNAAYVLTGSTTSSLPNAQPHELLQQLIHLADDEGPRGSQWANNLVKDTGPMPFPTASIWWTDGTRTKKIVDAVITRNALQLPLTVQWRAYASDGVTTVETYTDTILYSGVFEISRTRSQP